MKAPTKTEQVKDIAERMQEFRKGMNALVQKYNIYPEALLDLSPTKIETGIVLSDRTYKDRSQDEKARALLYKNFKSLEDAQPAGIEHEATQEAVAAMISGEGESLT